MIVTKALRMSEKMGVPLLGLVENMSYALCPHCGEQIRLLVLQSGGSRPDRAGLAGGMPLIPNWPSCVMPARSKSMVLCP